MTLYEYYKLKIGDIIDYNNLNYEVKRKNEIVIHPPYKQHMITIYDKITGTSTTVSYKKCKKAMKK